MSEYRGFRMTLLFICSLALLAGCTGLSATNVGEPTGIAKYRFYSNLNRVHVGMPSDSLEVLFSPATEAGEVGILHTSRLVTDDYSQEIYYLGWCSDPKHQIGLKEADELELNIAKVHTRDQVVTEVEILE